MSRTALVITHTGREEALVAAEEARRELEAAGLVVVDETEIAGAGDAAGVDFAVVLGGDGTILRAAELTRAPGVPILAINLGHVGFLAEAEREDISQAVRRLAAGDFVVEERGTLDVLVLRPGEDPVDDWALNEATLEKAVPGRMVEVAVEVDGLPVSTFGCDAVVLSTATGSTAHAFSAGGPVIWPDVDATLLVPVSAHALFARPLVVGPASVLAVEVLARSSVPAMLSCDGRRTNELPCGTRVEVRRSDVPVRLARLTEAPFSERLVRKFSLDVEGWRGRANGGR